MPTLPDTFQPPAFSARWSPGPEQPQLGPGEVHVWRAALADVQLFDCDILSPGEIIAAEHLPDDDECDRYIAFRVFLRNVLSRYTGIARADLRLSESAPFPIALSTLRFACSQSDDLALVAVSHGRDLGVDIQRVRDDLPFDEMAEHFFEPEAQWGLRTTRCPREKAWKFFDFWTTSEATSKAAPMHSAAKSRLSLHKLAPANGFLATLAVSGAEPCLALWDWR
jgi:4'-phosphopantetheinyl transferase